jgi:predicted rRNA methylase YqxC with S4 and FtsJ domains
MRTKQMPQTVDFVACDATFIFLIQVVTSSPDFAKKWADCPIPDQHGNRDFYGEHPNLEQRGSN